MGGEVTAGEGTPSRRTSAPFAIGLVAGIAVLSVTAVMAGARVLPTRTPVEEQVGTLTAGDTVEGMLTGKPDRWTFTAGAGDVVTIDLRRTREDLDPYLQLLGPAGGAIAEDDDTGGNLNSRIRLALEEDGEHVIRAGGLGASRGPYELSLRVTDSAAPAPRVVVDELVEVPEGGMATVSFEGRRGALVTITVRHPPGEDTDPYVWLRDPDGRRIAEDDDSGGNLDSLIIAELPADGTYEVEVESLNDLAGAMTVVVEIEDP
jgi:hypothetical protein